MNASRLNPNAPPFNPRTVASPELPVPAPAPAVVSPAEIPPLPLLYPPACVQPVVLPRAELPPLPFLHRPPACVQPTVMPHADLPPLPFLYPPACVQPAVMPHADLPPLPFLHPPACVQPTVPPGGYWCFCGRLGNNGCACAQLFMAAEPVFPPPAPTAYMQCLTPPLLPQPVTHCRIAEVSKDGSKVPPLPGKANHGQIPRLAFDPNSDNTSLMLRNIPNRFMKERLMAILDQHCAKENAKLSGGGKDVVKSEYDFVYVPVDFGTKCNKGYAFVNMTTPVAARRLHAHLHGHVWVAASSRKVCDVVQARFQGLEALVAHFSESVFPCEDDELLPARFEPPRDGVRTTAKHVVGRLQPSAPPATRHVVGHRTGAGRS